MKEYIERMKAVSVIKSYEFTHCPEYMKDWATKLKRAILDDLTDGMMEAPAADVVERKRGEWVMKETIIRSPYAKNAYCSECLEETSFHHNFCPNCGADMREVVHGKE